MRSALIGLITVALCTIGWICWRFGRFVEQRRAVRFFGREWERIASRNLPTAADPRLGPPCYWDAPDPWKRARCPKTACAQHGGSPWDCPLPVSVLPKSCLRQ